MKFKPEFSGEVTFGNVVTVIALSVTVGILEFPRASDQKVMSRDVARHEEILKQLTSSQNLIAANLQVLTAIVNNHLAWDKYPGAGGVRAQER